MAAVCIRLRPSANSAPARARAQPIGMTPENIIIGSNATHKWRAYYWGYFNETEPRVIEYGIPELWLGENLGMVVLSFERRDANATGDYAAPRPPQCMIDLPMWTRTCRPGAPRCRGSDPGGWTHLI